MLKVLFKTTFKPGISMLQSRVNEYSFGNILLEACEK